jgi:DNA polymerase kappa
MGLRCTHLVSTKKSGINFFGVRQQNSSGGGGENNSKLLLPASDDGEWEVWPEAEFEEAARQEREDDMNELEHLSQEIQMEEQAQVRRHGKEITPNPKRENSDPTDNLWDCPICTRPQVANDKDFNNHIDHCLSRQIIKEAVKDVPSAPPLLTRLPVFPPKESKRGKRKNTAALSSLDAHERKKAFFG